MQNISLQLPSGLSIEDLPSALSLGIPFSVSGKKEKYVLQKGPLLDVSLLNGESFLSVEEFLVLQKVIE